MEVDKNIAFITRTGILLAIALAFQLLKLPQFVTGPAVNAVLILAAAYVGVWGAVFIGLVTPLAALLVGILPPALVPMVPVIMMANAMLVLFFFGLGRYNQYLAVIVAAGAKFLTFWVALNYVLVALGVKLPPKLVAAFGVPQLVTALIGGLVAVIIYRLYLLPRQE